MIRPSSPYPAEMSRPASVRNQISSSPTRPLRRTIPQAFSWLSSTFRLARREHIRAARLGRERRGQHEIESIGFIPVAPNLVLYLNAQKEVFLNPQVEKDPENI